MPLKSFEAVRDPVESVAARHLADLLLGVMPAEIHRSVLSVTVRRQNMQLPERKMGKRSECLSVVGN